MNKRITSLLLILVILLGSLTLPAYADEKNFKVEFTPNESGVFIEVLKSGAYTAETPVAEYNYELPAGDYTYTASKLGFEKFYGSFTVSEEQIDVLEIAVTLKPAEKKTGTVYVEIIGFDGIMLEKTPVTITDPFDLTADGYTLSNNGGYTALHAVITAMNAANLPFDCYGGFLTPKTDFNTDGHGMFAGFMYFINNEMPMYGLADCVAENGDNILLFYNASYDSMYQAYLAAPDTVVSAESNLILTLNAANVAVWDETYGIYVPFEGASIYVNGISTGKITGKDGTVNLGRLPAGEYTITAKKYSDGKNILTYNELNIITGKSYSSLPWSKTAYIFPFVPLTTPEEATVIIDSSAVAVLEETGKNNLDDSAYTLKLEPESSSVYNVVLTFDAITAIKNHALELAASDFILTLPSALLEELHVTKNNVAVRIERLKGGAGEYSVEINNVFINKSMVETVQPDETIQQILVTTGIVKDTPVWESINSGSYIFEIKKPDGAQYNIQTKAGAGFKFNANDYDFAGYKRISGNKNAEYRLQESDKTDNIPSDKWYGAAYKYFAARGINEFTGAAAATETVTEACALYYLNAIINNDLAKMTTQSGSSQPITREAAFAAAAALLRQQGSFVKSSDTPNFADSDKISPNYLSDISSLTKMGIINGSGGYLNPGSHLTQCELMQLLLNLALWMR